MNLPFPCPPGPPLPPVIDFPNNPQVGDVFRGRWIWDGQKWIPAAAGGARITVSEEAPLLPVAGNLWWSLEDGNLYIWTGHEWVITACGGGGGSSALFTAVSKGLVPASGGGTLNFLRADGTWAAPPQPGLFTTTMQGVVPASGFVPGTFLRQDGTWQHPYPNLPNDTLMGNVSGGPAQPGPIDADELRWLIGTFPAQEPGLVPAPPAGTPAGEVLTAGGDWHSIATLTPEIADARLLGNLSGATAQPQELTAAEVTAFLDEFDTGHKGLVPPPGTTVGAQNTLHADASWGPVALAGIAPIAPNTVLGSISAVAAVPQELTQAQLTTLVNNFTQLLKGLVPPPGAASTISQYLRSDATWQMPGTNYAQGAGDPWSPPLTTDVMQVQGDTQVQMPPPVPNGRVIRVFNQPGGGEVSFTNVPSGNNANNWVNTANGWINVGPEFWTGVGGDAKMTELMFVAVNNAWFVINQGATIPVSQATQNTPATMIGKTDLANNPPTVMYTAPGVYTWTCLRTGRYQIMAGGPGGGGASWVGNAGSVARYSSGASGGVARGILLIQQGQVLNIQIPPGGGASGGPDRSGANAVFGTNSTSTYVTWPYVGPNDGNGPIPGWSTRWWVMFANFGPDGGSPNALNGYGDAPNITGANGTAGNSTALNAYVSGTQTTGTSWAGPVQITSGYGGNMLSPGGPGSALIAWVGP